MSEDQETRIEALRGISYEVFDALNYHDESMEYLENNIVMCEKILALQDELDQIKQIFNKDSARFA